MKVKRFMTEYISFSINELERNDMIRMEVKERMLAVWVRESRRIVAKYEKGFITADETMRMLNELFSDRY